MNTFAKVCNFFYFELSKQSRKQLIVIFFTAILIGILLAITPLSLAKIIENIHSVIAHRSADGWQITAYVFLYIICLSLPKVLSSYSLFAQSILRVEVVNDVSISFFNRLSNMPAKHFSSRNMGYLAQQLNQVNNEFYSLIRGISTDMISPVIQITLGASVLLAYEHYLVVSALLVYGVIFFAFLNKYSQQLSDEKINLMAAGRESYSTLVDSIQNISAARQYSSTEILNARYSSVLAKDMAAQRAYWKTARHQMMLNNLLFIIMFGSCFALTVFQSASGEVSVAQVVLVGAYIMSLSSPLEGLGRVLSETRQSVSTLAQFLDEGEFQVIGIQKQDITSPALTIKNLVFRYDDKKNTSDINIQELTIPPGLVTAITGPSGAGKSTLLRLLTGEIRDYEGELFLGKIPLSDVDGTQLNGYIGSVKQDPHIFQDTLRFNLRIANPKATDEALVNALNKAGMSEFYAGLAEGLDTVFGDRGTTLSGGQRQRISLARLFLSCPEVVILDESTASLDFENESRILTNIVDTFRGATIILVSHRKSVLQFADHIVIIEQGKVTASGTRLDVQDSCDYYRRLVDSQ
ncbi:MAG: ATP-binding cassette domain-containing protein [Advenella sp.]